jgi:hypothetical protein
LRSQWAGNVSRKHSLNTASLGKEAGAKGGSLPAELSPNLNDDEGFARFIEAKEHIAEEQKI